MYSLLVVVTISAAICGSLTIANWVLAPLEEAANRRRLPTQFTLADLLGLFFLLPVSTSIVYFGLPDDDPVVDRPLGILGWLVLGLIWWYGVVNVSKAGVRNPRHRVLFMAFVIPLTLIGTVAFLISSISVATMLPSPNHTGFAIACGATLVLPAVLYGLGHLTRHMMASTTDPRIEAADQVSENTHLPDDTSPPGPDGPTRPS